MKFKSVVLALVALISSCTQRKSYEHFLQIPLQDDVKTLDPANAYDSVSNEVSASIYESLYQYSYLDETYRVVPLLATSLPVFSKDKLKATIQIRTDAKFHDDPCFEGGKGRVAKAQDFIYSFKRLADPALESSGWWIWDGKIKGINAFRERLAQAKTPEEKEKAFHSEVEGMKAVDDHTIELQFTQAYPQILYILAMGFSAVVPEEAVKKYGDEKGNLLSKNIGTGPFILKEWRRTQHLVLERNPAYHPELYPNSASGIFNTPEYLKDAMKPLPLSEGIRFIVFKEEQPHWLGFLNGDLDMARIPKDSYKDVVEDSGEPKEKMKEKGFKLHKDNSLWYYFVTFNMQDSLVGKNRLLRQALASAVDRNEWIRIFTNGRGIIANTFLPKGIAGRPEGFSHRYTFDIERARTLLAKAGYPGGKGLPKLTYDLRGADSKNRQIGEYFVSQWEKIGVKSEAIYNTFPAFIQKMKKAHFQLSYGGWAMDYPDLENAYQILYGKNKAPGPNESNFDHPRFNDLYEKIAKSAPSPERSKAVREMEEILSEEVPVALGYYLVDYRFTSKRLQNYRLSEVIQNRYKYLRIKN